MALAKRKIVYYIHLVPGGPFRRNRMQKLFLFALLGLCVPSFAASQSQTAPQRSEQNIVKIRPLSLDSVKLTGGPLKTAQDLDAQYLLDLKPDRMLAFLR